jgi:hypothetical protein
VFFSLLEAHVGILCACMPGIFVFTRGVSRMARWMDPLENTPSNYSNRFDHGTRLSARPPDILKLDMAKLTVDGESGTATQRRLVTRPSSASSISRV